MVRHRNSIAYVTEKTARQLRVRATDENPSTKLRFDIESLPWKKYTRVVILAAHVTTPTQLPHSISALNHP